MSATGADGAGFGVHRRMDDDLILLFGDRDDLFALGAGAFLAGEFIGDAESLEAAWAGDLNRHAGK